MTGQPLRVKVREYLQADGYNVVDRATRTAEGEVSAWRPGPAGTRQYMNVWMPTIPPGGSLETQERSYIDRFRRARELYPAATNIMLVPSMEGIRTSFRQEAFNTYRVQFRTPIEFFDTTLKSDGRNASATIAKRIRDEGERVDGVRISQPFTDNSPR